MKNALAIGCPVGRHSADLCTLLRHLSPLFIRGVLGLSLAFLIPPSAQLLAGEARPPADEAKAKSAFEADYAAGAAATIGKSWAEAVKDFEAALKALGDFEHPKKPVARVLLEKARGMAQQEESLSTAAELLRLKQWAEAEAAYRKAAETLGQTEMIKAGIAAAQAGARIEKDAPATPTPGAGASSTPLDAPEPQPLDRDEWQQGAGSSCYWAGERLYLEEGDENFKRILSKDFAVAVALEARMDHRSQICLELRPVKDSGPKTRIVGWGSKDGSAPYLALDKEIIARGEDRPPREQITLAFVRNGLRIDFYCNGQLIGHTQDQKPGQAYHLWVCGKGILDGAKVIER